MATYTDGKLLKGSPKKRSLTFDIAKGIGMACIIAGHLGCEEINAVVFTFHVPLFFLIAGYFFKAVEPGFEGIKHRAVRLLVPYVLCVVACSLGVGVMRCLQGLPQESWHAACSFFVQGIYGSGTISSPILGIPQFGATWFLLALFLALSAYDWICNKPWATAAVLGAFAIGVLTRGWWLPFSAQAAMCSLIFVHMGWLVRNKTTLDLEHLPIWIVLLSVAAWIAAYIMDAGKMYLVVCYFTNIPVDVAGAIAGSLVIIYVSSWIARIPFLSRMIAAYGKDSLVVLCWHIFELKIIPWGAIMLAFGFSPDDQATGENICLLLACKLVWSVFGVFAVQAVRRLHTRTIERGGKPRSHPYVRSLDIAKGIAILSVVIASQPGIDAVISMLAFSFHIPLFFLANAAFMGKYYDPLRTLRRSIKTLVLPYAGICLAATMLRALVTPDETKAAVMQRVLAMVGGMSKTGTVFTSFDSVWLVWFVACLFVARNTYVLVRWATRRQPLVGYISLLLLWAFGWWLGKQQLWLPWSADIALFAQVFMLIGDETSKRGLLARLLPIQAVICVATAWAALALSGFQIEMAMRSYPGLGVLCVVCACLGSLLVLQASNWMERRSSNHDLPFVSLIEWCGNNSMTILAVHCLRMMWSAWTTSSTAFSGIYAWQVDAIFEIAFCVAMAFAWSKTKLWCMKVYITRLSARHDLSLNSSKV